MGLTKRLSIPRDVLWMAVIVSSSFLSLCSASQESESLSSSCLHAHFRKRAILESESLKAVVGFRDQPDVRSIGYSKHTKRFRLQKRGSHALKDVEREARPWLQSEHVFSTAGDDWHNKGFSKKVMFTYGDLLYKAEIDPDTLLLGRENRDRWVALREEHKFDNIPLKAHMKIRDWFGDNISFIKGSVYTTFDHIEWNLKRLNSDPVIIWWRHDLIKAWHQSSANWKEMIEIGEALDFHIETESHTIPVTKHRELKKKLRNLMHKFQGPYKSNNGRWGISQSILALRNTIGTTADLKTPLYDLRIEQVLGSLSPESDLGQQAAKLDPLKKLLHTGDLELHWFLNGLDPVDAEKIGKALFLGAKSMSNRKTILVEDEKKYIRDFYKILDSQHYQEGYTNHGFIQDWYIRALGEDEYKRRVQEVKRLYRRIKWSDLWLRWRKFFGKMFQKRRWTK